MLDCDIIIIGSGVVGLSIAKSCFSISKSVFVIDQNSTFGMETSSRNSEVIHSGIYYPENSLKSNLCILGRELLYDYCDQNNITEINGCDYIPSYGQPYGRIYYGDNCVFRPDTNVYKSNHTYYLM